MLNVILALLVILLIRSILKSTEPSLVRARSILAALLILVLLSRV